MSETDDDGMEWTVKGDAPNSDYYHRVRSPLKFLLLDFFDQHGEATYHDLAEELEMPPEYVSRELDRLRRRQLISRDEPSARGMNRRSIYRLSDRGRERLAFFRRQADGR